MLDRITGMHVFSRAAHTGSLSAAARQLSISPGMATEHLDALEERLGARLFHRSTRKLSLTEPGQQYLEVCIRLLPELEEVEAMIASQRVDATGLLRLNGLFHSVYVTWRHSFRPLTGGTPRLRSISV
jgi:DNA-binding transcriptional LysR family regulator